MSYSAPAASTLAFAFGTSYHAPAASTLAFNMDAPDGALMLAWLMLFFL